MKMGFIPLALELFDMEWAERARNDSVKALEALSVAEVVAPDHFVCSRYDALAAAGQLDEEGVDVLILQCTTFPASGTAGVVFAQKLDAPLVLWALPESSANGGPLRSNSLCGTTMIASTLTKLGHRFKFVFGMPTEQEPLRFIGVSSVRRRRVRIGDHDN